jgi:hypothetical protein
MTQPTLFSPQAALQLYRDGVEISLAPGFMKSAISDIPPWSLVTDSITAFLFNVLYSPTAWSERVNSHVYPIVAFILQVSQARNITIDGGSKYNVPSGEFTIDTSFLSGNGAASSQNLTLYCIGHLWSRQLQ